MPPYLLTKQSLITELAATSILPTTAVSFLSISDGRVFPSLLMLSDFHLVFGVEPGYQIGTHNKRAHKHLFNSNRKLLQQYHGSTIRATYKAVGNFWSMLIVVPQ